MTNHQNKEKPKNLTQTVIAPDGNFILTKTINNFTDVICPFKKINNDYHTNILLPINQIYRIQALYDIIPYISKFIVVDDMVNFDCTQSLPTNMFGEATEGYIHFTIYVNRNKKQIENYVDSKMVFQKNQSIEEINLEYDQNIKFKSNFLKVFPIILKEGIILTTIEKSKCQLYVTVKNPSDCFIGECSRYEIINMIQYTLPLWSIFNININKNVRIGFQKKFLAEYLQKFSEPIMLHLEYDLDNPKNIKIEVIGNRVITPYIEKESSAS